MHDNGRAVRLERTGWRDMQLSARHRQWGFHCPAVDLDFLMVEYNSGRAAALVEYKFHTVEWPNLKHPTYRALRDLCNGYKEGLPFLLAFYARDPWRFLVFPMNDPAAGFFDEGEPLSERDYVRRLYAIRGRVIERGLLDALDDASDEALAELADPPIHERQRPAAW